MSIFNVSNISSIYVGDIAVNNISIGDTSIYTSEKKWEPITWNFENFSGDAVWTDEVTGKVFLNKSSNTYELNKSTKTWNPVTWTYDGSATPPNGNTTFFDGDNEIVFNYSKALSTPSLASYIVNSSNYTFNYTNDATFPSYISGSGIVSSLGLFSIDNDHYNSINYRSSMREPFTRRIMKYNKSNHSWSDYTDTTNWSILVGRNVWTDGTNYYYSNSGSAYQYILDKSTNTWITKSWNGLESFDGRGVWTDGTDIYYSYYVSGSSIQYILDKSTDTWIEKDWGEYMPKFGQHIWTDGTNIYYSYYISGSSGETTHYILV